MKAPRKTWIVCLLLPLVAGGLSALLSMGGMQDFSALNKPPLSPPGWLFPVVWTLLYLMMGAASCLVATAPASPVQRQKALFVYGLQLIVNLFWAPIFFSAKAYLFAFLWLLLLWGLILLTALRFARIRPAAGWLLIPYLLWVTFAGYLNIGVYLLN